jgi:hypothetical protein
MEVKCTVRRVMQWDAGSFGWRCGIPIPIALFIGRVCVSRARVGSAAKIFESQKRDALGSRRINRWASGDILTSPFLR